MPKNDYPLDITAVTLNRRKTRRELLEDGSKRIKKKIAVLGGSTTNDIVKTLEIYLLSEGIEPEFYQSEYNRFWQDAMFENPELKDFAPDVIYIHTSYRNIAGFLPAASAPADEVSKARRALFILRKDVDTPARGICLPGHTEQFRTASLPHFRQSRLLGYPRCGIVYKQAERKVQQLRARKRRILYMRHRICSRLLRPGQMV